MIRSLLLVTILIITCLALHAQADSDRGEPQTLTRTPEYGIFVSLPTTGIETSPRKNWKNSMGSKIGIFSRFPAHRLLNIQAELHLQQHIATLNVPQPYPYVIAMKETLNSFKLRMPVTVCLLGDHIAKEYLPQIGFGLYLDTPLYCRKIENRDYISEIRTERFDITSSYPMVTLGMNILIGFRKGPVFTELRFSHDLTELELSRLEGRNIRHFDSGLVVGYTMF
ncbi:MAG: hypothetical protein Q8M98_10620 [Candidatus Cloacimonadaceae bacterium]|nr:hypothetical protein [Candidatus Cloacimonadaceae bacterium]MDP3115207.1 hypothetical protein [Candidatus Cloacimonadaceae bacterium]